MWFGNNERLRNVVIVSPQWVCSNVIGTVFMPQKFKPNPFLEVQNLSHLNGRVAKQQLAQVFRDENVEVVIGILLQMEICIKDENSEGKIANHSTFNQLP